MRDLADMARLRLGRRGMLSFYRFLLRLYPAAFREEYAKEMEQQFHDEVAEAESGLSLVWLWMRLLFDIAVSVPAQLAIEAGHDSKHSLRLWAKRPWHTGLRWWRSASRLARTPACSAS